MNQTLGLYLHIPFCIKKCDYCDFYSLCGDTLKDRYTEALLLHMQDYAPSAATRTVDTVFIGGGTPTTLPREMMLELLDGVKRHFAIAPGVEWTMETNPATVSVADLKKYRRAGVNRLSIGVQSFRDAELEMLGRVHTALQAEEAIGQARAAGFDNISIDLMYGIPGQTRETLRTSLEKAVALEPDHISLYNLILEEGTPLFVQKDSLDLPDEDTEYEMYESAVIYLESHGYMQYEISNFAKDGKVCRHNLKYWNCEEYLGLGPAAHSYYNERRFSFKRDISAYISAMDRPEEGIAILDECYDVRPGERVGEYIMLRMRLKEGLDTLEFGERFGLDFESMYKERLSLYEQYGLVSHVGSRYAFTLKGMYVSNYILSAMLDFDTSESRLVSGILDGNDRI